MAYASQYVVEEIKSDVHGVIRNFCLQQQWGIQNGQIKTPKKLTI
jgi:hypothetical protein